MGPEQTDTRVVSITGSTVEKYLAEAAVNATIVKTAVPECYYLIDQLLLHEGKQIPKDLKVQARRILPEWCDNAFKKKDAS